MGKKVKQFIVLNMYGDQRGEHLHKTPVTPSDLTNLSNDIHALIKDGNGQKLREALQGEFRYPGLLSSWQTNNNMSEGDWQNQGYESYYVRPVIEALFFESNNSFHEIIHSIQDSKHAEVLLQGLKESLLDTDLSKDTLFSWNEEMKQKILSQYDDLANYGQKLVDQGLIKGLNIKNLAEKLKSVLVQLDKVNEKDSCKRDLHILDIKLELIKTLHSKDSDFGLHRGYARVVSNIISILFTAGIANLIHKVATGNWLFFSQTTTQEKISNLHTSLGVVPEAPINFKILLGMN